MELLEDRRLLAVVTVDTELDLVDLNDGVTSLREAIFATNIVAGADEIVFDFGHDGPASILLEQGELEITDELSITGDGPDLLTIDAQQNSRIVNITAETGDFTIAGMTLTGGRTIGDNADWSDNTFSGGAIRSLTNGTLTVTDSTINDNSTAGMRAHGGGIYADSDLVVVNSTISDNFTEGNGGGISASNTTVTGSTISGNSAEGSGGGISATSASVISSTVSSNFAINVGGGINAIIATVTGSTITDNRSSIGGGIFTREIYVVPGMIIINDCTISNNIGGGLYADIVKINNSIVSGNTTEGDGGGISASNTTVTGSTISGNSAVGNGGGISASNATVTGSTISGNSAVGNGGGIRVWLDATVTSSTISGNQATDGGGGIWTYRDNSTAVLSHTIVAGNSRVAEGNPPVADDLVGNGTFELGYSLVGTAVGAINTTPGTVNYFGVDPLLGPLQDNGGPTETHSLLPGSPAIDAGDQSAVVSWGDFPFFDQRGFTYRRVVDDHIDIGALEHGAVSADFNEDLSVNGGDFLAWQRGFGITTGATLADGDANQDGAVNLLDKDILENQFGAEPIYSTPLVVDSVTDNFDGDISLGQFSLREAIRLTNQLSGKQTITFDTAVFSLPQTLLLTKGDLAITDSLTIDGPGADLLTIDAAGNDPTPDENYGDGSRIFDIGDVNGDFFSRFFAPRLDVSIGNMTLTGGDSNSSGGGIRSVESLTVVDMVISGNSAKSSWYATDANGGGISASNATVTGSTISGNSAVGNGGGISASNATVTGSTISGNSAVGNGGGIRVWLDATVTSSTISGNQATDGGGGIWTYRDDSTAVLSHTIVAGNSRVAEGNPPVADDLVGNGTFELGYSLVGTAVGAINTTPGTINYFGVDPLLGPLQDNGGSTWTHALLQGSPAIDAGDPLAMAGVDDVPEYDQRGEPYVRVADGDGDGTARIDIGAFEVPNTFVVDTLMDESDGDYSQGDLSLREAIEQANSSPQYNHIVFEPGLFASPQTMPLTMGELEITETLSVNGPGIDLLTIDAQQQSRIFNITVETGDYMIGGMTLTGGHGSGNGGAIRSLTTGSLTIQNSDVNGNSVTASRTKGGGIFSEGNLRIVSSTISGNSAYSGGGIGGHAVTVAYSTISGNSTARTGGGILGDVVTVIGSTISGNMARYGSGGGIAGSRAGSHVTITSSTISGNRSFYKGGGLWTYNGPVTIQNSILADNTDDGTAPEMWTGTGPLSVDYSLIGDNMGTGLAEAPIGMPDNNGNLIGGPVNGIINPLLGPLADNGGPTQTHALLPGSPALNRGDLDARAGVGGVPLFDQRGDGFDRVFSSRVDIGAFELQEFSDLNLRVDTLEDEADGNFSRFNLSLREAIGLANANPAVDTINFDPILTAIAGPLPPTIVLTEGELVITSSLTINGLGAELLMIDASGNDPTPDENNGDGSRVFNINDGDDGVVLEVTLHGLTIKGGDVAGEGGGINSSETLILSELSVIENFTWGNGFDGGGISSRVGNLTVIDSLVSENGTSGRNADGGGIFSDTFLTVTSSTISGNSTMNVFQQYAPPQNEGIASARHTIPGAFGGGIQANEASITNSTISGNFTLGDWSFGGGISADSDLVIVDSTINGNTTAGVNARGGGIYAKKGNVSISSSTISGNSTAGDYSGGGGIYVNRSNTGLTITDSSISGNFTTGSNAMGGGIASRGDELIVSGSTIDGNFTIGSNANGGGICSWIFPIMTITDSTISGNAVTGDWAEGGGIWARSSFPATIVRSTITGNSARDGGGGIAAWPRRGPTIASHSIISGNWRTPVGVAPIADDLSGNFELGYSLVGTAVGAINTTPGTINYFEVDPLLGPLADNGGPTQTHALLPGSPAIDAGDPTIQQDPDQFDQRGDPFLRVADGDLLTVIVIDMGAYEAQAPPSADFDSDHDVDGSDFLAWQRGYGTTVGATRPDGNSDDDQDVDASDLAAWEVSFDDGVVPMASAQSVVSDQSSPPSQQAAPTHGLRAELVDAAIAMDQALQPKSGARMGSHATLQDDHSDWIMRRGRWDQPPAWQGTGEIVDHSFHGHSNKVNDGRFYRDPSAVKEELLDKLFAEGGLVELL